jgi:hypothetical protein
MVGQGAARAAGQIGQANAYAQGAGGISNAVQGGMQNYMLMNALNGGGGFGGGFGGAGAGQEGMISTSAGLPGGYA